MSKYGKWISVKDEPVPEAAVVDVWQSYVDTNTGEVYGNRFTNCWVHNGDILSGPECSLVRSITHWMFPPEAPT